MAANFQPFHVLLIVGSISGVATAASNEIRRQGHTPPEVLTFLAPPGYEHTTATGNDEDEILNLSSTSVEYFPPPPPPGVGGGSAPDSKQFSINQSTWDSWWKSGFTPDKCFHSPIPFPDQGDGRFEAIPDWTDTFYLSFVVKGGMIECFEVHNERK